MTPVPSTQAHPGADQAAPESTDEAAREIFVNRRRFAIRASSMTGAAIAALIGVPEDNAVVERQDGSGEFQFIPIESVIAISPGTSFLVTRQFVMGGHDRG